MPSLPAYADHLQGLTDKQADFVRHLARYGDKMAAAAAAQYSQPETEAWRVVRLPQVQTALAAEMKRVLLAEGAPLAFSRLYAILRDSKTAPKDTIAAARIIIDRAGFVPPSQSAGDHGGEKPLEAYSAEELRAKLDQVEAQLANRAKEVSAPKPAEDDGQKIDTSILS